MTDDDVVRIAGRIAGATKELQDIKRELLECGPCPACGASPGEPHARIENVTDRPPLCSATTVYHDAPDGNPHPLLCARPRGHGGDHLSSSNLSWPA
jgi:hypothetical protein